MNRIIKRLAVASALAALFALAASGGAGASSGGAYTAAKCQKATNIEAIIDDSGSMDSTDASKFRTTLLDAFAALQPNQGKTLGGIEFGDTADVLFTPATIPGVVPIMDASFAKIQADNGLTDYNLAFNTAAAANPTANGRIFLSDGGHNVGPYNNGHAGVKTDTVGFGSTDEEVLNQIASDTGGRAFNLNSSAEVPAVAAGITASMSCQRPPVVFIDTFANQGQQFVHKFKAKRKVADILLTWPLATSFLDVLKFAQVTKAGKASVSSVDLAQVARRRGVKTRKKKGTTFVTVRLKGLKKGAKVNFRVKARTLASPTVGTTSVIR